MLFRKYHEVFAKYVLLSILVDDYDEVRRAGEDHDNTPVTEFLEGLDLDTLKMMTTIQCIGVQTTDTFEELDEAYMIYQHYYSNEELDMTKEDYIHYLTTVSWEWGTAFTFVQGLERLGIRLEEVPTSNDLYEGDLYYCRHAFENSESISYLDFRNIINTLFVSDFQFFDVPTGNKIAQTIMLRNIQRLLNGKISVSER